MPADGTHRHDEFHRGVVPHEQLGSNGPVATYVLTASSSTPTDEATWEPSGGGGGSMTVELLGGTGAVGSVTVLRVAKLTNNTGGDVSLLPQITGTGSGGLFFDSVGTQVISPDGRSYLIAGNVGAAGGYLASEHTPGDLVNRGINLEVGNDYVGLFISEKDSSTVQIYDDLSGSINIEFVEQDAAFHFKFVHVDGGVAIPALGMLPQYGSAPHSGTETEGEMYYDTTLHVARCWDGSSWNDLF